MSLPQKSQKRRGNTRRHHRMVKEALSVDFHWFPQRRFTDFLGMRQNSEPYTNILVRFYLSRRKSSVLANNSLWWTRGMSLYNSQLKVDVSCDWYTYRCIVLNSLASFTGTFKKFKVVFLSFPVLNGRKWTQLTIRPI